MPVYNAGAFLDPAVRSILDQTVTDLELIAVDDGSTDGSADVLDRLATQDPRVRIIRRPNTGVTGALNDGLAAARAPVLARMDADDIALPTRLEKQLAHLDAHPHVGLITTAWTTLHPDGTRRPCRAAFRRVWAGGSKAIARALARGHNVLAHPTAMIRRTALNAAGGHYDPTFEPAEDFELWLRLSRVTQIACLPEPLLDHRQHPASICATRGHEQLSAVRRAVHAHWQATAPPTRSARQDLHRHLANLALSTRDRHLALSEAARGLIAAPLRLTTLPWFALLVARYLRGCGRRPA